MSITTKKLKKLINDRNPASLKQALPFRACLRWTPLGLSTRRAGGELAQPFSGEPRTPKEYPSIQFG